MKHTFAAVAVTLLASTLASASNIVTVTTEGHGLSRDSAIESALIQAIRQVNGTQVNSQQSTASALSRNNDDTETRLEIASGTDLKAKGQIAGYQILNNDCSEQGCVATLSVDVHQYKTPGLPSDKRRRIAVMDFTGGKEFRKSVTREVREQLVQSRRFAVLDRQMDTAFENEKALWESGDVSVAEKARLGQVLGLDYIVVGSIDKAGVHRWSTKVDLTGEEHHHVRTSAKVNYQVIAVPTRQIKWSDSVSVTLNNVSSLDLAANATGKKIASDLLNNIYPLRVAGIHNDQIIINQGGKTIKKGSRFDVFSLGEAITDPYTGESLGQSEQRVATVTVSRVDAKMSYARVIDGDMNRIQGGQVIRPSTTAAIPRKVASPAPKRNNVIIPSAGGVIL